MGIKIIGLGAGDLAQLPLGVYRTLQSTTEKVYVRTNDHPVIEALQLEGMIFTSFDDIYEKHDQFSAVYEEIVTILLDKGARESIIYAVPGHPLMAEQTVQKLLNQKDVSVEVIGGQSFLDAMFTTLQIDPIEGFQLVDATSFTRDLLNYENHLLFAQVYDMFVASEVKLQLLEDLPADHEVVIVQAAGSSAEEVTYLPLEELDRVMTLSNLTTVYVPPIKREALTHTFHYLKDLIQVLRSEDGCPWDRAQTHESLRRYAIEEVYELIDAINQEDDEAIVEELGDVLLQVMLHSQIGEENGYFSIDDVIRHLVEKVIRRHPHVFDETVEAATEEEVREIWEDIKQAEGKKQLSILHDIKKAQPALEQSLSIQEKVAKVGFDWDDATGVWAKLEEEIKEVKEAIEQKDKVNIEEEFGDIFFVLTNLAKWYKVVPEVALQRTNEKFISRFQQVEQKARAADYQLADISFEALNQFWNQVKEEE